MKRASSVKHAVNLNHALIPTDRFTQDAEGRYHPAGQGLFDCSFTGEVSGSVSVYFRNLADHLVQHIDEADVVLGCVAWLTEKRILGALARKSAVSIIVQKEDFLRPDGDIRKADVRRRYAALPDADRLCMTARYSCCGDPTVDAVRCVGVRGSGGPVSPRSHHKFVLFAKCNDAAEDYDEGRYRPYAVWTGSFNFTWNGGLCLENAIVLDDPRVVEAYYGEYLEILGLSEPLDWESEYVAPEWRLGT